jgi:hypothetical protein
MIGSQAKGTDMAKCVLGVALLLIGVSSALGQDNRISGGMMNGYMWRQMSEDERAYYAVAISEVSSTLEDSPRRPVNLEKCKCNVGQLVEGVDKFYKQAAEEHKEWMRLPVLSVFVGESWRRSGEPLAKISLYYAGMLEVIAQVDKTQERPR